MNKKRSKPLELSMDTVKYLDQLSSDYFLATRVASLNIAPWDGSFEASVMLWAEERHDDTVLLLTALLALIEKVKSDKDFNIVIIVPQVLQELIYRAWQIDQFPSRIVVIAWEDLEGGKTSLPRCQYQARLSDAYRILDQSLDACILNSPKQEILKLTPFDQILKPVVAIAWSGHSQPKRVTEYSSEAEYFKMSDHSEAALIWRKLIRQDDYHFMALDRQITQDRLGVIGKHYFSMTVNNPANTPISAYQLIAASDLVISAPNFFALLALAMGKEVWLIQGSSPLDIRFLPNILPIKQADKIFPLTEDQPQKANLMIDDVIGQLHKWRAHRLDQALPTQPWPKVEKLSAQKSYDFARQLLDYRQYHAALPYIEAAVKDKKASHEICIWCFETYYRLARLDDAAKIHERIVKEFPQVHNHFQNGALVYLRNDQLAKARAAINNHIKLNPKKDTTGQLFLGQIDLLQGKYQQGIKLYEKRLESVEGDVSCVPPAVRYPRWNGETLAGGKRLLIWGEQGIGDEVMFASFLKPIIMANEQLSEPGLITLSVDERLVPILARSFPTIQVISNECIRENTTKKDFMERVSFDYECPFGSLLKNSEILTSKNNSLCKKPYLKANIELENQIRSSIHVHIKQPLIGISWYSGNPIQGADRSLPPEYWPKMLEGVNATFVNLQYGIKGDQLNEKFPADRLLRVIKPDPMLDLEGFTSFIHSLDMVLSIDNNTIHFAGALGVETWAILNKVPHWRWGLKGTENLWYGSVSLFRQKQVGNWQPVIVEINRLLREKFP